MTTSSYKFGKLISALIEKSWPKDRLGRYMGEEDVVLQHLLSWTATKNIFHLHGTFTKLSTVIVVVSLTSYGGP